MTDTSEKKLEPTTNLATTINEFIEEFDGVLVIGLTADTWSWRMIHGSVHAINVIGCLENTKQEIIERCLRVKQEAAEVDNES